MSQGVRAAGGIVIRSDPDGGARTLIVHRPHYDDWTFPKGKCEPGETDAQCAVREVEEETGLTCDLGDELPPISYVDHKGRPKQVRYWLMTVAAGDADGFVPNDEVDEVRWVELAAASPLLTYERDQAMADLVAARRTP